ARARAGAGASHAATAEAQAANPTQSPDGADPQASASPVTSPSAAADASRVVGQAYRELVARLFREVQPSELLTAGWKGVREEAKREGMTALDTIQPFSDAGSADIDSFLREFTLFVSGPGGSLDSNKLAQAAIRGMTASVGDSHTRYLTPAQSELQDRA